MHGLANVMMLAASLRGGALVVPPSAGAGTVQVSPYDEKQWGGPVAPWSNPLDHDLLYRSKEAKDRVWVEPYKGKAPLIAIASAGDPGAATGQGLASGVHGPVLVEERAGDSEMEDVIVEVHETVPNSPNYFFGAPVNPSMSRLRSSGPGVLGETPDGRGIVRDTLFRRDREGVAMLRVDSTIFPLCAGFHIPTAEDRAADLARYERFKAAFPEHERLKESLTDRVDDPNARVR